MVGLDTNIVVRFVMQDDARQAVVANRIFNEEISPVSKGYIASIVLCEAVWVLVRSFKLNRRNIATAVETLLQASSLEIEHRQCAWDALRDFKNNSADYSDCLLARVNRQNGAPSTLTFDQDASQLEYFRLAQ